MLLQESMEKCVLLNRQTQNDGYGGYITTWTDGAEFEAAIVLNTSIEAKIAQQQGVTGLYTVTTSRMLNLQYHDVFRRVSDGKVFRITTDGDDKKTPMSAGLDMRQTSAEEWVLQDG